MDGCLVGSLLFLLLPLWITGTRTMKIEDRIQKLQDIIGQDAGGRGMKSLIVPGDLLRAAQIFGSLSAPEEDDAAG